MIIYEISVLTFAKNNAIIRLFDMRVCWNRQTGTFEGRVSLTYGFKSRHSHHKNCTAHFVLCNFCFCS